MVHTATECLAPKALPELVECKILAFAAPAGFTGCLERGEALAHVELTAAQLGHDGRLRAAAAFVLEALPRKRFEQVLGYTLPTWADKGPEGQQA